ncbi:MAG: hypothetical protein ACJ79S_00115 [Gemmatimonadaceae bacterium]
MYHHDPLDPQGPAIPAAVGQFLTALRTLELPAWRAALAAARARTPGDAELLDALTVLSITTARLELGEARRVVEERARWTVTPALARLNGPGQLAARRHLSEADEATLLFAAEWAAVALLVREAISPQHFGVLYEPFRSLVPPPPGSSAIGE